MPRVGRVAYTPPVPVYRVTALPGPGECSRKETAIDQAAGSTGAEVRNPTERVSFGVVKVLADGTHATGFVAGESGLIVTHGLVVSGASGPRVEMHDGESFQGRVVGVDNRSGLAYLEVRADRDLTPVSLGNSDEVCVGDNVTAVGFSGQGESESLKAHHGQVTTARDGYFRIDSSLNDEILGGPFLNAAGDVIGVSGSGIVIQNGGGCQDSQFRDTYQHSQRPPRRRSSGSHRRSCGQSGAVSNEDASSSGHASSFSRATSYSRRRNSHPYSEPHPFPHGYSDSDTDPGSGSNGDCNPWAATHLNSYANCHSTSYHSAASNSPQQPSGQAHIDSHPHSVPNPRPAINCWLSKFDHWVFNRVSIGLGREPCEERQYRHFHFAGKGCLHRGIG